MVRFASTQEKAVVRQMWRDCFHEDERYLDLYFSGKYHPDWCVVCEQEGMLAASLQLLRYPLRFWGQLCHASYFSGVCTLPAFRKQGMMGQMMQFSLEALAQRGVALAVLIPAEPYLFSIYAKYGFSPCFERSTKPVALPEVDAVLQERSVDDCDALYRCYARFTARFSVALEKTPEQFHCALAEHLLWGGRIFSLEPGEEISAFCLTLPTENGGFVLREVVFTQERQRALLLAGAGRLFGQQQAGRCMPWPGENTAFRGMVRAVNLFSLLQAYAIAHPALSATILVEDPILPQNSGCFALEQGECRNVPETTDAVAMDLGTLSAALCGCQQTQHAGLQPASNYMNLMMD